MRAFLEDRQLSGSRRYSQRRKLRLQVEGLRPSASAAEVLIHNLSHTGLLIETCGELSAGELLDIVIPEAGIVRAEVVWQGGRYCGCQFREPISSSAVNAALLRSPARPLETPSSERLEPPRLKPFLIYTLIAVLLAFLAVQIMSMVAVQIMSIVSGNLLPMPPFR